MQGWWMVKRIRDMLDLTCKATKPFFFVATIARSWAGIATCHLAQPRSGERSHVSVVLLAMVLHQDLVEHFAADVCQTEVAAVEAIGQLGVFES